jgi:hypothetical protein
MADLHDPTVLAVARVKEETQPFSGWASLPGHHMDFLKFDLTPMTADCGCRGQCACSVK